MADQQPAPVPGFFGQWPQPAPVEPPNNRNNIIEQNQAIRENAEDRVGMFVSKFIYWFRIAMFSALVLEIILVLILRWKEPSCPQPLRGFLIVFAVNSVLLLTTNVYFFKDLVRGLQPPEPGTFTQRLMTSIHRTTELMDQLIMIFGFFMLAQPSDCNKTSPVLWAVCVQIVALRFAIWILPLLLLTCMFCCFGTVLMVVSKYRRWRNKQRVVEMLNQVPKYTFKTGQREYGSATIDEESADCAICLSSYEEGSYLRVLECNHHYHQDCIDQWLCLTPSCPLCKREVLHPQGEDAV